MECDEHADVLRRQTRPARRRALHQTMIIVPLEGRPPRRPVCCLALSVFNPSKTARDESAGSEAPRAFPATRSAQPCNHHFRHGLHRTASTTARKRICASTFAFHLDFCRQLAGWPISAYARSCALVLRARIMAAPIVQRVVAILEVPRRLKVAGSANWSCLATRRLGYAVALRGELQRKMGLCSPKSSSRRSRPKPRRLAIPRGTQRATLA
jgi:hypothetical protein